MIWPFYIQRKEIPVRTGQATSERQGKSRCREKHLFYQSVASHFTDWAFRARNFSFASRYFTILQSLGTTGRVYLLTNGPGNVQFMNNIKV
jgi:hypothetical protein